MDNKDFAPVSAIGQQELTESLRQKRLHLELGGATFQIAQTLMC